MFGLVEEGLIMTIWWLLAKGSIAPAVPLLSGPTVMWMPSVRYEFMIVPVSVLSSL